LDEGAAPDSDLPAFRFLTAGGDDDDDVPSFFRFTFFLELESLFLVDGGCFFDDDDDVFLATILSLPDVDGIFAEASLFALLLVVLLLLAPFARGFEASDISLTD